MKNLEKYLCSLSVKKVWMYFFASGCACCPAKDYCAGRPEGTCCRENFTGWAELEHREAPDES